MLKGYQFVPGENGMPDFQSKIKVQRSTFSAPDYFKTVFISGDDMVKEQAEQKQREIDEWNKKVVVKNTHFYVNTLEKKQNTSYLDKYKNIREGDAKKIGLKNKKSNISTMVERQIMASRAIEDAPVSMMKEEAYLPKDFAPGYKVFDKTLSFAKHDMDTNIGNPTRKFKATSTKKFIEKMQAGEKVGAIWGN